MECVEQCHLSMSTLALLAKKATEKCSEKAGDQVLNEVKQLQTDLESVQSRVANEKAQLESCRMQLADYDDAVKRELAWMQDIEQYFANTDELCADLAEKKSRLQQTKVDLIFKITCPHAVWFVRVIILVC